MEDFLSVKLNWSSKGFICLPLQCLIHESVAVFQVGIRSFQLSELTEAQRLDSSDCLKTNEVICPEKILPDKSARVANLKLKMAHRYFISTTGAHSPSTFQECRN